VKIPTKLFSNPDHKQTSQQTNRGQNNVLCRSNRSCSDNETNEKQASAKKNSALVFSDGINAQKIHKNEILKNDAAHFLLFYRHRTDRIT